MATFTSHVLLLIISWGYVWLVTGFTTQPPVSCSPAFVSVNPTRLLKNVCKLRKLNKMNKPLIRGDGAISGGNGEVNTQS